MNEFIEQFLLEARELIEQATSDLLALEHQADDPEKIDGVFRAFHTLKGAAGIVDFEPMGRALHAVESILAGFRSRTNVISPTIINECLACLDQVTRWLDDMEASGEVPSGAGAAADAIVRRISGTAELDAPASPGRDWLARLRDQNPGQFSEARTALRYVPNPDAFFRSEDPLAMIEELPGLISIDLALSDPAQPFDTINPFTCAMEIFVLTNVDTETVIRIVGGASNQIELHALDTKPRADSATTLSSLGRSILEAQVLLLREPRQNGRAGRMAAAGSVSINVLRQAGLEAAAASVADALNDGNAISLIASIERALREKPGRVLSEIVDTSRPSSAAATRVLRVDTTRIDTLINLTGELTVVKNALGHLATRAQAGLDAKGVAANLRDLQTQLDRLVGEVQRAVLRIRVLPMRQMFQRFPRPVREISASVGKLINFTVEGDDTEADKAIVESLFEPLLHVLRNAIDHGIEDAEERQATGKPSTATIVLRAFRQLDNVIVEIEDDGRGVDVARVREVAAARGLVAADTLARMTDAEIVDLIFVSGFSTAREVTDLSGRGVGMDAVRTVVERLGGRVSIDSRPNVGSVVRLTLPFTVMMTRLMTIESAGQVFGLPLDMVIETAIIPRDRIVSIGGAAAFAWRDKTVPLISLATSLGLGSRVSDAGQARVVITSAGGQLAAIEVERLGERMDVMLKPMEGLLGGVKGVTGTTLLGDGRVLIVLDVQELFN
jgi:two-component system, chemotaxis family, sensor kinase CheA